MKKAILMASMMLAGVCAQAQLQVNETGNIAIQTTETPSSTLSVGYAGSSSYSVAVTSVNGGVYGRRMGSPTAVTSGNPWTHGVTGANIPNGSNFYVGVKGFARISGDEYLGQGRAYGVFGEAGNTTAGYNYGVYGQLNGTKDGAAIFGTLDPYDAYVPGRYAGYFAGDIKVTGTIYGSVLSVGATSNAISAQTALATDAASASTSVTNKLSQLLPVQYSVSAPVMTASSESDTATAVRTLSELEIQHYQKPHYGLVAAELKEVLPELVYEDQQGNLCINYIEMVPLLVQSIKELKSEIATLKEGSVSLLSDNGAAVYTRSLDNTTSVEESTSITIPALAQNDPNPFTESTTISYSLPESVQSASIYIYDMNGTQICQLPLSERGNATVTVSGGELKAGMYLYSLIADGKVIDTKRMILTK